jgi:hypothetical protein
MPGVTVGDAQCELRHSGFTIWEIDAYLEGQAPLSNVLASSYTTLVAKKPCSKSARPQ